MAATYRVYGLDLISEFEFPYHLPPGGGGGCRLSFRIRDRAPDGCDRVTHRYSHPQDVAPAARSFHIDEWRRGYVLGFVNIADFYVERNTITCRLTQPQRSDLIAPLFFGVVLAFWLEWRGRPVLHGSAVAIDGRALLFVGPQRAGKSTIAAALAASGERFIADDMLALERVTPGFRISPGHPEIRLWPEQMKRLFPDDHHRCAPAHGNTEKCRLSVSETGRTRFDSAPRNIARVYLPTMSRHASRASLEPLAPADGLMCLLAHSFLGTLADTLPLPLRQQRLAALAALVDRVPVARLIYRPGGAPFSELQRLIRRDLAVHALAS